MPKRPRGDAGACPGPPVLLLAPAAPAGHGAGAHAPEACGDFAPFGTLCRMGPFEAERLTIQAGPPPVGELEVRVLDAVGNPSSPAGRASSRRRTRAGPMWGLARDAPARDGALPLGGTSLGPAGAWGCSVAP